MSHHLSLVFTNAMPGRDDEFNDWYQTIHVREVLDNIPGFASVQRYELNPSQREGAPESPWRYLAVYQLDTDDVAESHRVTEEFKAAHGFTPNDGALAPGHAAWVYAAARPGVTEADVAPNGKRSLGEQPHLFLAFTNPATGREEDFERWYDIHVPEVVGNFPGLRTGRLYHEAADQRIGMEPRWGTLALYDLVADDVDEYHRCDHELREGGTLTPHAGALDPDYAVWVYSERGPRVTRS